MIRYGPTSRTRRQVHRLLFVLSEVLRAELYTFSMAWLFILALLGAKIALIEFSSSGGGVGGPINLLFGVPIYAGAGVFMVAEAVLLLGLLLAGLTTVGAAMTIRRRTATWVGVAFGLPAGAAAAIWGNVLSGYDALQMGYPLWFLALLAGTLSAALGALYLRSRAKAWQTGGAEAPVYPWSSAAARGMGRR